MTKTQDTLSDRLDRLEAETHIRSVLAEYMYLCDRLDADTDMKVLGELFSRDAIWGGRGDKYKKDFGTHKGRKAIVKWLKGYCTTPPHFAMNAHFLSSETIKVSSKKRAKGRWLMLQTPTFHDGQSFLMSAELNIEFEFEQSAWRMSRFQTTSLYSRKVADWDQAIPLPVPPGK